RRRERALPVRARPPIGHEHPATHRAAPAPVPPRVRHPPARGRGRPARHPGAPRPQFAVDDADLQPRRRQAAAQGLRPGPSEIVSRRSATSVETFLAVAAARLAPRTIDSYRRDLSDASAAIEHPLVSATSEELERYLAGLRARGLSPATIARRLAALRAFFRHQQLLGTRADNPAAEVAQPRRIRTLPRTLSASEAERLIDAAAGTTPRAHRDAALVELLYGAGLRVSEAVGLEKNGVDLEERLVRCVGKGDKE